MRKLFTLLTVVLASVSAWAQFDEPELQKVSEVKIDGTTEYFLGITNSEGDEYFYGKGNNWGTRTSVKASVSQALSVRFAANPQTIDSVEYNTIKFNNYVSDKGGWGAYVDCDGGLQAWVDGQNRTGDGKWLLTDLGNGQIELANLNAVGGKFGLVMQRMEWSEEDGDYTIETGPENADNEQVSFNNRLWFIGARVDSLDILDEEENVIGKRAKFINNDTYTTWQLYDASTYNAKMKLSKWYWDLDENTGMSGYDYYDGGYPTVKAAIDAAIKAYDDPNSTAADIEAAYDAIIKAIDWLAVEENAELLEGATPEDPIELFEYGIMQNPKYDEGTTGWEYSLSGVNNQVQSASYSNGGVSIQNFLETWTWDPQLNGSGYARQKVGLPEGLYILGVDVIATRQTGSKADSKGVQLFASNGDEEYVLDLATGNNAPEHFEIPFSTKGGTFTIGIRYSGTTCNWLAIDNWSMTYYGNSGMSFEQINLGKNIQDKATRYNNHAEAGDHMGRTVLVDAYDAIFEAASAAYENGGLQPEEYTALSDSLTKAYNAVSASIQDYKQFKKNMDTVEETIADQQDKNAACAAELEDYMDELLEEYEKAEWTRAEIDLILSTVSEIMGKYTNVQPGDDVTFYLFNPKFTKDFSGWQTTGTSPVWGANYGNGVNNNADLCQAEPEEEDGLAERFKASFSMYQTIINVPAGLYTLSVQGFNRVQEAGYNPAELYAVLPDGSEKVQVFANVTDYGTEDRLYEKVNDNGDAQWESDNHPDGAGDLWCPNSMSGAAWHFMNKSNGVDYDYTNKFQILMKEPGNLTIGVRCDNGHQWVIFDNFTLVYEGEGAAVWIPALQEEADNVEKRVQDAGVTTGEEDVIFDVTDKAYKMIKNIGDYTEDDCSAMLQELRAQYAEITKNVNLQKQIESFYEQVYNLSEKAEELDDAELQARYEAITNLVDGDYDDLNNTEMEAKIEEIKAVIALVKMPKGWQDASDENPVDFSAMIANRYFNHDGSEDPEDEPAPVQNHNFTEWQGKQPGTGGGQPGNCGEVWNSGAFDMYQELTGLPEGTYVLSCQGFLRHSGGTADSYKVLNGEMDQSVYAYLYGNSSEGQYSTELCNITEVQLDQTALDSLEIDITPGNSTFGDIYKGADQLATADNFFKAGFYNNSITVKVGADGVLRVGIQKIGAVGQDWVVVDNFSLMYLGGASQAETSDDPKTAISEVETVAQKAIYTITGVRTAKATKPGLYIINGKKIVVK